MRMFYLHKVTTYTTETTTFYCLDPRVHIVIHMFKAIQLNILIEVLIRSSFFSFVQCILVNYLAVTQMLKGCTLWRNPSKAITDIYILSWVPFQYPIRHLIVRSRAARMVVLISVSLWNLTGTSAAHFRAIVQLYVQISRIWDFARSDNKTSYQILKWGPCSGPKGLKRWSITHVLTLHFPDFFTDHFDNLLTILSCC